MQVASVVFISFLHRAQADVTDICHFDQRWAEIHK